MAWYHEHIKETPGVCGGYPCIGKSRISVRLVVEAIRQGATFDEMLTMWPHITRLQLEAAICYYLNEPQRVDEDIRLERQAWEELTGISWEDSVSESTRTK